MTRQTVGISVLATSVALAGTARAQNNHDHRGQIWSGPGTGLWLYSTDASGLGAVTLAANGAAVYGSAASSSGNAAGVWGETWAPVGAGVYGTTGRSTSGSPMGVYGDTAAPNGRAVVGWAEADKGQNYGVIGQTNSRQGTGVYGYAPYPGNAGYFAGNAVVAAPGSLSFGSATRQMLNLWGPSIYGIGVQPYVMYFRTDGGTALNGFAWYKGGTHADNAYDSGGGTMLMKLDQTGLTVNGTFVSSSDAALKQDVEPLDVQRVLDAVGRLPIREWSYRASPEVRHLGPMAQDFQAAFGVGADDRHIAMVDADGVALASIQALRQLVAAQQAEIAELRAQMAELRVQRER